ncbi:MAG: AAA family ATPase [Polyangiaceae bacterium]|nr:AAA family ATPase [Polyangiaceae bacterium]
MKLIRLEATSYRSLKTVEMTFEPLNVLIGTNASGKSNILDALRLLSEGMRAKDFAESVAERGGIIHLAWKGEEADQIRLVTRYEHEGRRYEWTVRFRRLSAGFAAAERVQELHDGSPPSLLLDATSGKVEWWSTQAKDNKVKLALGPTACALAAACADESFPGRAVGEFLQRWGFFDPSPPLLRRASNASDAERLDPYGRNLAARLYALQEAPEGSAAFKRIVTATRRVLGVPDEIKLRLSEFDGRVYFMQSESGLAYNVHQIGASSGTLRMLALMTALFGETNTSLVGIEEPENHVHPAALKAFAEYLRDASERAQIVVTTHSPLLLDCLSRPREVAIVRRTPDGTKIEREKNPEAVDEALEASGFGLGEFYETKGFGA